MNITLRMSDILRKITGQYEPVSLCGGTPAECLEDLASQYPVLEKWLYQDTGKLKPHVWLLVNDKRIYEDEFDRSLRDGDVLFLMVAVLGG